MYSDFPLSRLTLRVLFAILLVRINGATLGMAQEKQSRQSIEGVWEGGVGPFDPKTKTYKGGEYILTITKTTIAAKTKEGEDYGEGTYKLDPDKKTIDVVGTKGQIRGQTFLGIYSLEGRYPSLGHDPPGDRAAT